MLLYLLRVLKPLRFGNKSLLLADTQLHRFYILYLISEHLAQTVIFHRVLLKGIYLTSYVKDIAIQARIVRNRRLAPRIGIKKTQMIVLIKQSLVVVLSVDIEECRRYLTKQRKRYNSAVKPCHRRRIGAHRPCKHHRAVLDRKADILDHRPRGIAKLSKDRRNASASLARANNVLVGSRAAEQIKTIYNYRFSRASFTRQNCEAASHIYIKTFYYGNVFYMK